MTSAGGICGLTAVIIILSAALIGYVGGKLYPKQFPAGKGHGKSGWKNFPA